MATAPPYRPPAWEIERARFNHDWLKNGWCQALAGWLKLLEGKVDDPWQAQQFLTLRLGEWPAKSAELSTLLGRIQAEMSPRLLLAKDPLSRLNPRAHPWMADALHAYWLTHWYIAERLAEAERCRLTVDETCGELSRELQARRLASPQSLDDAQACVIAIGGDATLVDRFRALESASRALGVAIERFPRRIAP